MTQDFEGGALAKLVRAGRPVSASAVHEAVEVDHLLAQARAAGIDADALLAQATETTARTMLSLTGALRYRLAAASAEALSDPLVLQDTLASLWEQSERRSRP